MKTILVIGVIFLSVFFLNSFFNKEKRKKIKIINDEIIKKKAIEREGALKRIELVREESRHKFTLLRSGLDKKFGIESACSKLITEELIEQPVDKTISIEQQDNRTINIIKVIAKKHYRTLKTKKQQLVTIDSYGNYDYSKYFSEIEYFYKNVFLEKTSGLSISPIGLDKFMSELFLILNSLENKESYLGATRGVLCDNITPQEFELLCINKLKENGWSARGTKGSGDQGIDVIAEKNSIKAVIQCKYYSRPVGNKAVQEIVAGKQFERADIAAVVTNSRYTKSAEQLAQTCDVRLLHVSELEDFDRVIMSGKIKVKTRVTSQFN